MKTVKNIFVSNPKLFFEKLLYKIASYKPIAYYSSSGFDEKHKSYRFLVACGAKNEIIINTKEDLEKLDIFLEKKYWSFGYISYDAKNFFEDLKSNHPDGINLPQIHFFNPKIIFEYKENALQITYDDTSITNSYIENLCSEVESLTAVNTKRFSAEIIQRISYNNYLNDVEKIKRHIHLGDIYEMNYCMEFYAHNISQLSPLDLFHKLNKKSPAPFSCLYLTENNALISSSPERFLKKTGNVIISQPIKGTASRGTNSSEDIKLGKDLQNNEKERSENIMIVDLVRNDLSRVAQKSTVKVDELCGLYAFPTVYQLISTISAQLRADVKFSDILRASFPPGSMTGAPKIRAMQIIEQYEKSKRGLYAGAVGYITPAGDFDFNVVIRSILMNFENDYLSFHVGGAITALSDAESEYNECMLKARAMREVLEGK